MGFFIRKDLKLDKNMDKCITNLNDVPLIKRILILSLIVVAFQFSFPHVTYASIEEQANLTNNSHFSTIETASNAPVPYISQDAFNQTANYNQLISQNNQIAPEPATVIIVKPALNSSNNTDAKKDEKMSKDIKIKRTLRIPVTAYSSTVDQCDDTPFITASGTHVRDGIIAANFLPIGTKVRFPEAYGDKVFVVEDRMNARYNYHADIWMETREQAKQWGIKHLNIEILEEI